MDSSAPRGVLLVHGAWHTGHAWNGVARGLRDRGVPVAIAELHRGSLIADIAAAAAALDMIPGPAIACGHSYGGAIITGLDPRRVAHLVYLAAAMPDVGESSLGLMASAPHSDLPAAMIGDPYGMTTIDPTMAGTLFHGHLTEEQQTDHTKALVPQLMTAGYEMSTIDPETSGSV